MTFESSGQLARLQEIAESIAGDFYYYAPYNPNFGVNEFDQVDVLNLYNGDSPSNDIGELTLDRIRDGMSNGTAINGRILKEASGTLHLKN